MTLENRPGGYHDVYPDGMDPFTRALETQLSTNWRDIAGDPGGVSRHPVDSGLSRQTANKFADIALSTSAVRALPPPRWLFEDLLVRDSLALLYGASGVGKSFVGVALTLCGATGTPFFGHAVDKPAKVVYVAAEGVAGIGRRVDAWAEHHRDVDSADVYWIPQAVNLVDPVEVAHFAVFCESVEFDFLIVDTLARCSVGGDENSARDMGVVVSHLDYLRRLTGACVLGIHHSGKDATSGARGSSALRAALDTEIELTGAEGRLVLTVTKQKDAEEAVPLHLELSPIGESCVLLHGKSHIDDSPTLTPKQEATLEALRRVEIPGGVSATVWRLAVGGPERSFYEHRKKLITAGYVVNVGTENSPKYQVREGV